MSFRAIPSLSFIRGTPVEAVANVMMAEGTLNHKEPGTEAIVAGLPLGSRTRLSPIAIHMVGKRERDGRVVIGDGKWQLR
ncbi:hypothetical protein J1N35_026464 [Gossypium stocksii]|uniref:Uncharacterized protein n=1 Tax=Gossypium stocksii TaxID=47602 RepID=A0A9D3V9T4_9ROSI|nr:hypothetical protein J1N35_026464 [Gossypium stocksii]